MNTQYRKNLKAVAQACKNYTDKEINKLYYDIGHNDITTDDHIDEASYKITAPANAKLLMLQSIGGNAVKYNPSVASDSTKAMIKTMPSTVYTFDGSKFEGDSEVSENLLVLSDVAETTSPAGITYKIENGVIYINGTCTTRVYLNIATNLSLVGQYTLYSFCSSNASSIVQTLSLGSNIVYYSIGNTALTKTLTSGEVDKVYILIDPATYTNTTIKPMLVKGSTAPTEFKVGYTGIHNLELSGLKVEGANLIDTNGGTISGAGYVMPETSVNLPKGTYSISCIYTGGEYLQADFIGIVDGVGTVVGTKVIVGSQGYCAFNNITLTNNAIKVRIYTSNSSGGTISNVMLNLGSTALPYEPYVSTTKTIDLSTILYNGSPLFEGNSLKAVGTAKDYITPYLAHKQMGYVDLGSLEWNVDGENLFSTNISLAKANSLCLISSNQYSLDVDSTITDKEYRFGTSSNNFYVRDYSISTTSAFKTAMSGVYLVYELATPIEVSIDWSATLRNIQGYPNGSIIAENTYNMDVESVITYNSIIQETLVDSVTITRNGVDILTRNLPTQASDGWSAGTQRNYRVFCDYVGNAVNKREGNVNKEDLGNIDYTYSTNIFRGSLSTIKIIGGTDTPNMLSKNYTADTPNNVYNRVSDKTIASSTTTTQVWVNDTFYTDATIFKNANVGNPLYYELADASKTETDMDDFDFFFDVEEGDVITFNNPYAQQVYATYSFLIKEAKSNE